MVASTATGNGELLTNPGKFGYWVHSVATAWQVGQSSGGTKLPFSRTHGTSTVPDGVIRSPVIPASVKSVLQVYS